MVRMAAAVMSAVMLTAGTAAAETSATLRTLLIKYRCPVVDRLDRIYDYASPKDSARHVKVHPRGLKHVGWVECSENPYLPEPSDGFRKSSCSSCSLDWIERSEIRGDTGKDWSRISQELNPGYACYADSSCSPDCAKRNPGFSRSNKVAPDFAR